MALDIDANGILNVTAKDQETGKEQKITISGSTSLDKSEIDRMVQDAQQHSDEDKRRREEADIRNQADSAAYQAERQLRDLGDRAPAHIKARAEQLIADIRQALQANAPIDRLRSLTGDLQQAAQSLTDAAHQQSGNGRGPETQARQDVDRADDVIDAEFTSREG